MRPSFEQDTEGLCILHSRLRDKDKEGAFTKAINLKLKKEDYDFSGIFFPGNIFLEAEFSTDMDFSNAIFEGKAIFANSVFNGKVRFIGTTFSEEANFYDALFLGDVDFGGAIFLKEADFSSSTFKKHVLFYHAIFSQEANFSSVTFQSSDFYRVTFSGDSTFALAAFGHRASFTKIRVEDLLEFDSINSITRDEQGIIFNAEFDDISILNNGRIRFRDLSMSHSSLNGTDLRKCEFFNVEWYQYRGRQAIYGEVLLNEKELSGRRHFLKNLWGKALTVQKVAEKEAGRTEKSEYARVEESYRYLKLSYEKAGDFKRAGDFHYGEMEMHRRASKWRWFPFYWYNLYRVLNGYGERPSRCLGWLALSLVIFTGLLSLTDLKIIDIQHSPSFGDHFFYLLQKVTFQRPSWAEPVGFWGNLVAGLSVLFIPGQTALFLLALRNRLGRRR